MRLKLLFCCLILLTTTFARASKAYRLKSPDGKLTISINTDGQLTWAINHEQTSVITASAIGLSLNNGETLGKSAIVTSAKTATADLLIGTPFYKKDRITDHYNQLVLTFKGAYGVIFRAYNDGAAFRLFTSKAEEITILNEQTAFNFKDDDRAFLPFVNDYRHHDKFNTSFEALYNHINLSAVSKDSLAFLPVLVELADNKKAAILDADIQNYPGMYLTTADAGTHSLQSVFAQYPVEESTGGYNNINYVVNKRADYIAKVSGHHIFPWRVVIVSTEDRQLADNDMVQRLSQASKIVDMSWIKPGKVAWDWWNNWNVTHVDFKAGINVPTYKYYIDFAAANKLEYIIIDEGWSNDADLTQTKLDVKQIVDYGKQKNVGVILWATWYGITRNTDAIFDMYQQMGIKGFKIDFIDRDDQKMVNSLYDIARKAADHHLLVDYHGMYKPAGLQRTYPNVINCEGVKGLENNKWGVKNHPEYDVSIPFIRMLGGPMDYTPGAMRNATKANYRAVNGNPMSQGTRCHQLAMYTVFEAPLQMLADNPTTYMREQESTDFIAAVPTTFDRTVSLDGKVGEFVSIARQKGNTWYAGIMSNWDPRDLTIDLSFLGAGNYRAVIFEDGINADRDATDYVRKVIKVTAAEKLQIKLASGGGWAARFERIP